MTETMGKRFLQTWFAITALLPFAEVEPEADAVRPSTGELLSRLERGEASVTDVLSQLQQPTEGDV